MPGLPFSVDRTDSHSEYKKPKGWEVQDLHWESAPKLIPKYYIEGRTLAFQFLQEGFILKDTEETKVTALFLQEANLFDQSHFW